MKEQIEEMKIDVLESIAWKDLDDDVTALDIDSTTEHLRSKGYRKQEWISVEDRLPDKEGDYLVFIVDYLGETRMETMKLFRWANRFDWSAHMGSRWEDSNTITHWMPLPEPPKMKGGVE